MIYYKSNETSNPENQQESVSCVLSCEAQHSVQQLSWESARFQAVSVAWSWFRENGVTSSRPPAGNASL